MRIETDGFKETAAKIAAKREAVEVAVGDGQEEFAEELKDEVQKTAPVRTGNYRDDWEVEEVDGNYYLVNDVDYARYLVFPNSKFVGSAKADQPGKGILHNVRGIVYSRRNRYKAKVVAKIKSIL